MKKIALVLSLSFIGFAAAAHADMAVMTESDTSKFGFYVEPGLSYQVVQSNINYSGNNSQVSGNGNLIDSSAESRGVGILAKIGFHFYERFFAAADVRYGLSNFNDNANHIAVGATGYNVAPVVGYQMKDWGMRVFVGYVVAGNFDPDNANGVDLKFNGPTGFRVGVGMKLKMFSVNVEWEQLHYNTVSLTGSNTTQADVRYNPSGLVASLTFPIEI